MKREELEAIKARCEAASDGPWHVVNMTGPDNLGFHYAARIGEFGTYGGIRPPTPQDQINGWKEDLEFSAHAREDIPALIAEVERMWNLIENLGPARTIRRGPSNMTKLVRHKKR